MSINPITVTRLKTFVLLGHSNGDGWVGTEDLFDLYAHLEPGASDRTLFPQSAFYKNVYAFTNEHPWPGDLGTPQYLTTPGQGEWLELAIAFPSSPGAPFPHASPFVYPNNAGAIYPHWYYKAYDSILLNGDNGVRCGVEIPFQWLWRNHWNEQVGLVKLAFGSSFLLPADQGASYSSWFNVFGWSPSSAEFLPGTVDTNQYDSLAWWTPADQFDFAPSTGRFFQSWLRKMAGAQAALPTGTKMDVRLIIAWLGDNDSLARLLSGLSNFKQFVKEFVSQARAACVDNDWTTLPKKQIPIVWPGIHYTYDNSANSPTDTNEYLNGLLQEIADEDQYFKWISTDSFSTMFEESQTAAIDTTNHFGAAGYFDAAQAIYDAYLETETEPFDAIAEDDRVLVSEVKDRVRTYYNRSRSQTDATDANLLIHINGSLNRLLNDIGDNAYWLRRRKAMNLQVGANNITSMPKYVARVLKIENPRNIKEGLQFQLIGHADGGRCQIHLLESSSGAYTVHFITRPRDVTLDTELVPLPRQIVEWLVVETTRRLARSSSNVALQASLEGEARELRDRCIKELQVQQRAKRDRLHTVRRWPNLRYGNRGRRWGSDSSQ